MVAWAANFVIVKSAIATAPPIGVRLRPLPPGRARPPRDPAPARRIGGPPARAGRPAGDPRRARLRDLPGALGERPDRHDRGHVRAPRRHDPDLDGARGCRDARPRRRTGRASSAPRWVRGVALVVAAPAASTSGSRPRGPHDARSRRSAGGPTWPSRRRSWPRLSPLRLTTWAILFGTASWRSRGASSWPAPARLGDPGGARRDRLLGDHRRRSRERADLPGDRRRGPQPGGEPPAPRPGPDRLFAALALGEPILAGQVLGGVVIVAGILIARRAPVGPPPGGRRVPEPTPLLEA